MEPFSTSGSSKLFGLRYATNSHLQLNVAHWSTISNLVTSHLETCQNEELTNYRLYKETGSSDGFIPVKNR